MCDHHLTIPNWKRSASLGPAWILLGLCILLSAEIWSTAPVATGMAIVALGTTVAMLERMRRSSARMPVMLVHLAIYGNLYALFVGATLHAANERSGARLGIFTLLDIVVSVVPMLLAAQMAWRAIEGEPSGDV